MTHPNPVALVDQRPVCPLPALTVDDWQVKVYGIAHQGGEPATDLVSAGRELAAAELPQPALDQERHGVGFTILHDGLLGRWAIQFWWSHHVWLHQQLFHSPVDNSRVELSRVTSGLIACVYELQVIEWERQAWHRHVLNGHDDLDAYLNDQLPQGPALTPPPTPATRTP